jgi:FkbM family methyltransferase
MFETKFLRRMKVSPVLEYCGLALAGKMQQLNFEPFDLRRLGKSSRTANRMRIRSRCQMVRLENAVLCRVLGRYKMYVDSRDTGLAPHLIRLGTWEFHVTEAIIGFIRSGMTVVDVGANQGYYTMLLADLVGPDGRVYAAEPNPRMMSLLRRSAQVNEFGGRISLVPQPLSARSGDIVTLHVPDGLPQNGSMMWNGNERSESFTLTTTTLDELIGDGPVDFIKIDVEGAEEMVWMGMERIIARNKPLAIFLEFTPDRYSDPVAFLKAMLASGFELGQVHPRHGVRSASINEVLDGPVNQDRILTLVR